MRARTVAEKSAWAATVLVFAGLSGCGEPDPPRFGSALFPPLSAYLGQPDLEAQLRAVESETGALGLTLVKELRGELARAAGPMVVRAYTGRDALGRETHAVRVATSRGVVMALGPLAASDSRD
ncbi:MAG: VCBS repeat-containing protein, partial [Polyangiaceae bacterium]|nr:VCBS repeat-containing protein [Polyangiaceae bacterium]